MAPGPLVLALVLVLVQGPFSTEAMWPFGSSQSDNTLCEEGNTHLGCRCTELLEPRTELDCSGGNLSSGLPDGVRVPGWVQTLDLSSAGLQGELRAQVWDQEGVASVRDLRLSRNRLRSIAAAALQPFRSLRQLDLSFNLLQELSTDQLQGLQGLQELRVGYNRLTELRGEALRASLPDLRALVLTGNDLSASVSADEGLFADMPQLRTLDLSNCSLRALPAAIFNGSVRLQELVLQMNPLTEVPQPALQPLGRSLLALDMSATLLDALRTHAFHGLFALQRLRMDRMPLLQDVRDMAFSDLDALRMLSLRSCPALRRVHAGAFRSWTSAHQTMAGLRELLLDHCDLRSLPARLLPWPQLTRLQLQRNPWTCDCSAHWLLTVNRSALLQPDATCMHPARLRGVALADLLQKEDLLQPLREPCPPRKDSGAKVALVVLGSLALALALLVMGCLAFRTLRDPLCACACPAAPQQQAAGYLRVRSHSSSRVDLEWDNRDIGNAAV